MSEKGKLASVLEETVAAPTPPNESASALVIAASDKVSMWYVVSRYIQNSLNFGHRMVSKYTY